MSPRMERVRVPASYPREKLVVGELHLLRSRLDGILDEVAAAIGEDGPADEAWRRVEEAARLARRAIAAAVTAAPPIRPFAQSFGDLRVGDLRVSTAVRRQWYGDVEFELTPLHHRLLAVMAADPFRVFGKDELLAQVWRGSPKTATNAVNTSVSRVRRALVGAGAPRGRYMISLHNVGWSLTRP